MLYHHSHHQWWLFLYENHPYTPKGQVFFLMMSLRTCAFCTIILIFLNKITKIWNFFGEKDGETKIIA